MFVFLVLGILESGSVPFFRYEFVSFFETELFFSMRVLVVLASGIFEIGSVPFLRTPTT